MSNHSASTVTSLLLTALLALAPPADAGSGRFNPGDGTFDIIVTLSWDASAQELQDVQDRFTDASELLWDVTDGAARFGDVLIYNDNAGVEFADVLITLGTGGATGPSGPGVFGVHVDLYTDDDIYAPPGTNQTLTWKTVAHEFAHYAFNIRDEYQGPSGSGTECVEAALPTACLMDDYKNSHWGFVSELCWSGNHDPDGDSGQEAIHGESCWETVDRLYPSISAPAGEPEANTGGFADPDFQVFDDPVVRVALVLDTSGSMNLAGGVSDGVSRIDDLNMFAQQFIDLMGQGDVELGIITYGSSATEVQGATLLDSAGDVTTAKGNLPVAGSGRTNIGDGLATGRDLLTDSAAPGPLVMILMTDGFHNWPENDPDFEPLNVLPSVIDEGIHVHTVGLGSSTNEDLLRQIAEGSGAIYWTANDPFELEPIMTSLAAIALGGSVLDAPQRHALGAGEIHLSPGFLDESGEIDDFVVIGPGGGSPVLDSGVPPPGTPPPPREILRRIYVEEGNVEAVFNLGWSAEDAVVEMLLITPDGQPIAPDPVREGEIPGVRLQEGPRYRSYRVENAQEGFWGLGVVGVQNPNGTTYAVQPTIRHHDVRAYANGRRRYPQPGDDPVIVLEATARDQVPISGLDVTALMTDPTGGSRFLTLLDDGDPARADNLADDGVYSVLVDNLQATGNGVYHFEVYFDADADVAVAVPGEEPPPTVDNRDLYDIRTFRRSFAVDVTVDDFPGTVPGDCDGDGIPDVVEGNADTDGDGQPDRCDRDTDGDDHSDRDEGTGDPDCDGIPSYRDRDSDGDGLDDNVDPEPHTGRGCDPRPDPDRLGPYHFGVFMGGFLFDERFPIDRELLYGVRLGRRLNDRLDFEGELILASPHDRDDRHGFLVNVNALVTADFGTGKIVPFVGLGAGYFDFSQFSPAHDADGVGPFLAAGLKLGLRPRLTGRIETRYLDLSNLDLGERGHFAVLWGVDVGF